MEQVESHSNREHVIDIRSSSEASSSGSSHNSHSNGLDTLQHEDQPSTSVRASFSEHHFFLLIDRTQVTCHSIGERMGMAVAILVH